MSQRALLALQDRFGDAVLETGSSCGDEWAVVDPLMVDQICRFLRDEPSLKFELLIDITAVDYLGYAAARTARERFEVVIHLASLEHGWRLRLKLRPGDAEHPAVKSLTAIYRIANWMEREVWDLYGIEFIGHPDRVRGAGTIRRLLLYEEFEGHPLRKDYPIDGRQPLPKRPERP